MSDRRRLADAADAVVDGNGWLERLTGVGWIAKAVVYVLMGVTAVGIARQDLPTDDASPQGSLGRVAGAPFGRILLAALAVGLVLYTAWRVLSVAVIRGSGWSAWGDRVGYSFSAVFYLALSTTAGRAALSGADPDRSNTVEEWSRSVLTWSYGRWILGVAGFVTVAVGLYFIVRKGLRRSFVDDLGGVGDASSPTDPAVRTVVVAGVLGWLGRGAVTVMVGFFVIRAAYRFDPDDARGFDRALRQVAGTTAGAAIVFGCAMGLIAYGVFCFLSRRYRTLRPT